MWGGISLWFWFAFLWWLLMLNTCTRWPSVRFFFWGKKKISIQALFPVFNCFFFFNAEFYECFVYFGYLSLIRCIVCKYILPLGRLPLCFIGFPFTVRCFSVWHSTLGLFLLLPPLSEKTYPKLVLLSVHCLLSSRSFMVSGLTVKSWSHFEFTFVYGMIKYTSLTSCM